EPAKKADGLEIFASSVLVRDPTARGSAVIKVEHGSHSIHAQPIDAIAIKPEQTAGQQEVCDLGPPVVVNEGVPVLVTALHGVVMLVKGRSIEPAEPMRIVGEVPRHPVKDDRQTFAVTRIDQCGE